MAHKELTKAEEQVMGILWKLGKGFLKDIIEEFPQPRPAYTTVSTVIRVLVRKEFVGFKAYGRNNEYYPRVSKTEHFKRKIRPIVANYFNGSMQDLASFFTNTQLSLSELEEVRRLIDQKIKALKHDK